MTGPEKDKNSSIPDDENDEEDVSRPSANPIDYSVNNRFGEEFTERNEHDLEGVAKGQINDHKATKCQCKEGLGGNEETCGNETCDCETSSVENRHPWNQTGDNPTATIGFGPPPSVSSPEWDDWADRVLSETEFDTELGKELAQDAFAVASGKLSKSEFHERYEAAVFDEFGVDNRPTKAVDSESNNCDERNGGTPQLTDTGGESKDDPLPRIPSQGDYERRSILKAGLATAGLLTVGSIAGQAMDSTGGATVVAGQEDDGDAVQMGMAIDMERCIACMLCVEGCKEENNTSNGANWMHVFRFSETDDDEMDGSMPRPCQHCSDPSCTYVCPTQARYKRKDDGIVLTDYELCIGCRYCEVGCPYGVNYFEWGEPDDLAGGFNFNRTDRDDRTVGGNPPEGVMGKCTFCVHRQDDPGRRGTTACEEVCPVNAIHFGDMNDPDSDPNQHIERKSDSASFNLLEEQGTEPNIVYIGDEPSMNARPVDGPFSYDDIGVEERRDGHNVYEGGDD